MYHTVLYGPYDNIRYGVVDYCEALTNIVLYNLQSKLGMNLAPESEFGDTYTHEV